MFQVFFNLRINPLYFGSVAFPEKCQLQSSECKFAEWALSIFRGRDMLERSPGGVSV